MPEDTIVNVINVFKSFPVRYGPAFGHAPRRRAALKNITFDIRRGECFGLLGQNGAGKTTLLKLLATLTLPDRGLLTINGLDVSRNPDAVKRFIGLAPSDERSFFFRLTARQNLEFFGALQGYSGKRLREEIDRGMRMVDLEFALDRRFGEFSSGMRQRLILARALLGDPDILLLDEPTRALDPLHADDLHRLVRDELVRKLGKTVIIATNILHEAWTLCDRIAIVNAGEIVALGTPADLMTKHGADPAFEKVTPIDVFRKVTNG